MRVQKQRGFTIIETLIVVAITGLLLTIGFLGQGAVRDRARFSDALESLEAHIETVKTESIVTANTTGVSDPGSDINNVLFGKLITFTPGSDEYTVKTLVHPDEPRVSNFNAVVHSETTTSLRWGLEFTHICTTGNASNNYCGNNGGSGYTDGRSVCVLFFRSLADGRLDTITMSKNICESTNVDFDLSVVTSSDPYVQLHPGRPSLNFIDHGGRKAVMLPDSRTANGSVEVKQL